MDEVLTPSVAALAAADAIRLERVAQDGMWVRADAGAASFRRQASLEQHLAEAGELLKDIKQRAQSDPAAARCRAARARQRAAQEREERIGAALEQLPQVQTVKRRNGDKPDDARASTTDADARVMKMGDGGFRPAFSPKCHNKPRRPPNGRCRPSAGPRPLKRSCPSQVAAAHRTSTAR